MASSSSSSTSSAPRQPTEDVQTMGWDTVNIASLSVVNAAIMAERSFPSDFNFLDSTGLTISGKWTSWQMIPGGGGATAKFACIVTSGTVSGQGLTGDLTGGEIHITLSLTDVPSPTSISDPTATPGTGQARALVAKTKSDSTDPSVSVTSANFPQISNTLLLAVLNTVFQNYFIANLSTFTQTFAVMNLNEQADQGDFQWLKPTSYTYAIASPQNPTVSNSSFGLISMVEQNPIVGDQELDSRALWGLPSGANSAFVISEHMVAKHILMQGAIATIQGSTAADFALSSDGLSVTNIRDIVWGNFEDKHGKVHSPVIAAGSYILRAEDTYIYLEIDNATFEQSAGITVHMHYDQKFSFKTIQRTDNSYVFVPDTNGFGSPNTSSYISLSEGLIIAQIITGAVAAIAGLLCAGSAITSAIADAVAAGADVSTESAANTGMIEMQSVTTEVVESANPENLAQINETSAAETDAALVDPGNPAVVQRGGIFCSTKFRLVTGLISAMSGVAAAGISIAKSVNEQRYDDLPAFDTFAANCLGASKWPLMTDYELISASFRNSLVIAVNVKQA